VIRKPFLGPLEPLGSYTEEEIRTLCAGMPALINNVVKRVQAQECTCCGLRPEEAGDRELELQECGHYLCNIFCKDEGHICVACALAV
jgi:hypothetical protein